MSLIPSSVFADVAKTRMRVCTTEACKSYIQSAEVFKRRYCKGDEKIVSYRPNCYQTVDRIVMHTMQESKFPEKADHGYWAKFVKQGEIHVPASKRADF